MNSSAQIILLTSSAEQSNPDILLLKDYLTEKGLKVGLAVWSELSFPVQADLALIGPVWDYTSHYERFLETCNELSQHCLVINPDKTIQWNANKVYLKELIEKGVRCIPSQFFERWDEAEILDKVTFDSPKIIKPSIGAGGRNIFKATSHEALKALLPLMPQSGSLIVQDYMPSISRGEISSIFIYGQYSHSVLKQAAEGEFRVQDHFGGTFNLYNPTPNEIRICESVLEITPPHDLARVDYIPDSEPVLVEVELIEPDLFLRLHEPSIEQMYQMILRKLT